jgi:hypothetical protein
MTEFPAKVEAPATCPRLFAQEVQSKGPHTSVPPSVPRSIIVPLFHRKGCAVDRGWSTGLSQNGLFVSVPITPEPFPQFHAVLWRGRRIFDLDTLPGGRFSIASGTSTLR